MARAAAVGSFLSHHIPTHCSTTSTICCALASLSSSVSFTSQIIVPSPKKPPNKRIVSLSSETFYRNLLLVPKSSRLLSESSLSSSSSPYVAYSGSALHLSAGFTQLCGMRKFLSGRQARGAIGLKGNTTVAAAAAGDSVVAEPRSKRRVAKEFAPDQKLVGLRKLFESVTNGKNLDAYIVPSEDAHQVRVVSVPGISVELCGGTHISNTAEIPWWKITSDQGIAPGLWWIEAFAQSAFIEYINARDNVVKLLSNALKVDDLAVQVSGLQEEVCASQNEASSLRTELLSPTEETKPNTQHTRVTENSKFGSHGFDTLLCYPGGVSTDTEEERVFISDTLHNRVIITDRDGTVIDCIGSVAGFEDGPFETSQLHSPASTSFHAETNCLFIVDCENYAIRKADLSNRVVQTVYPLPEVSTRVGTIQSLLHWLGFTKTKPNEEGKEEGKNLLLSFPWHLVMVSSTQLLVASYGFKNLWTINVDSGAASEDINQEPHEIAQKFLAFKSQAESVRGGNWDHACEKLESMGSNNLVSQVATLKDHVIFSDPEKEQVLKMDLRTGSISSLELSNLELLGLPSWWSLPVNPQFSSSVSSTGKSHQVFFQSDVQELCECFKVQPGRCLISVDVSIPSGTSLVEPVSEGSVWRQSRGSLVELSVLGGQLAARKITAAQQYMDDLHYFSYGDDEISEESLPIPKPSASGLPLFSLVEATRGTGEVVFDAVLYLKHTGPPKASSSDQSLPTMPGTTTVAERPSSSTPATATNLSNVELLPPPLRRPTSLFKNAKQPHDFPEGTVLLKHLHLRVRLEVSDEAPEDNNNNVQIHVQL